MTWLRILLDSWEEWLTMTTLPASTRSRFTTFLHFEYTFPARAQGVFFLWHACCSKERKTLLWGTGLWGKVYSKTDWIWLGSMTSTPTGTGTITWFTHYPSSLRPLIVAGVGCYVEGGVDMLHQVFIKSLSFGWKDAQDRLRVSYSCAHNHKLYLYS